MDEHRAEPASGTSDTPGSPAPDADALITPTERLRRLGPRWMALAEDAFAGVTQSPERYVAAGRWVGVVRPAAHGSGLLKLGATLLAGRKGPRRYTGLITGAFGW